MKASLAIAVLKSHSLNISSLLRYEHQTDEVGPNVSNDYEKTVRYTEVLPQYGLIKRVCSITSIYSKPFEVVEYTNLNGDYVGDYDTAKMLMDKGIEPMLASPDHSVCSIGFCPEESKWYGWSHRAMNSFGIGSEVKFGDIAYGAPDVNMHCKSVELFYSDMSGDTQVVPLSSNSIKVTTKYGDLTSERTETFHKGKGEWMAESLDDAKHMATQFAESVSCCTLPNPDKDLGITRSNFNEGITSAFNSYFNADPSSIERAVRNNSYSDATTEKLQEWADYYRKLATTNLNKANRYSNVKDSLVTLLSESSARVLKDSDLDSGNFAWYEYTSSKPSSYDHHSKNLELTIERGEFFGICYDAKRNKFLLTTLDSFYKGAPKLATFQVSRARVMNLIRKGRVPSILKIEGIPITRGNGDPKQAYHGNVQYDFKDIAIETSKEELNEEDIQQVDETFNESKIGYLAYFVSDVFKRDLRVFASDDVDELKAALTKSMYRAKDLASPGVIVAVPKRSSIYKSVISQRGKAKTMQLQHTKAIMGSSINVIDSAFAPSGVDIKTGGAELRPTRTDLPKRTEPVIAGNEDNVLKELQHFVGEESYFSNAFRSIGKGPTTHGNKTIVKLAANNADPIHDVEADSLIRRVESFYLVPINGKRYKTVKGVKSKGKNKAGDPLILVVFYVNIPKPWRGLHAKLAARLNELNKKGKLDRTIRYRVNVVGEPKPVQVDIHSLDLEKAELKVKNIRSGEVFATTNLFDSKGTNRIL